MASGNINMRDPVLYRILHAAHPRTGEDWCIYPTYDFAHGQSDAIEGVTHSLCTLEFEDHRPLYDWLIERLPVPAVPRQYEFSRLNLSHTVLSKRRLTQLVDEGRVDGWDDPRMPTICGLRRRGVPPAAIRDFVGLLAISKTSDNLVEQAMLDHAVRERLNKSAPRRFGVLRPVKLTIENYPRGRERVGRRRQQPGGARASGTRQIRFSRTLYVEADDFMEESAQEKFFRLAPGREVRLRYGYLVTCREAVKDASGAVTELRCTYDPETRGGQAPDGRKVRGGAALGLGAGIRSRPRCGSTTPSSPSRYRARTAARSGTTSIRRSRTVLTGCRRGTLSLADTPPGETVQFERQGYFCPDPVSPRASGPCSTAPWACATSWARQQARAERQG